MKALPSLPPDLPARLSGRHVVMIVCIIVACILVVGLARCLNADKKPGSHTEHVEQAKAETQPAGRYEWPEVVYQGKPRDRAWLESAYERFRDKIALVDGRFVDTGAAHLWADGNVDIAQSRRVHGQVSQVIGGDAILLSLYYARQHGDSEDDRPDVVGLRPQLVRVKGVSTKDVPDHAEWQGCVAAVGTLQYRDTAGAIRTISDCRPLPRERQPLTRTQFAKALGMNFQLIIWRKKHKEILKGRGLGTYSYWEKDPLE